MKSTVNDPTYRVVLAGNPNAGKSTIFNALTGSKQHTGNWAGKTVDTATGYYCYNEKKYSITDLPGIYGTDPDSPDERSACEEIEKNRYDCLCIVADASALRKSLVLILQLTEKTGNTVICLNLWDEAKKRGLMIDTEKMSAMIGAPVVPTTARSGKGLARLKRTISETVSGKNKKDCTAQNDPEKIAELHRETFGSSDNIKASAYNDKEYKAFLYNNRSNTIYESCVRQIDSPYRKKEKAADRIFTSSKTGIPCMLLLIALIFYITIIGANYPSGLLGDIFAYGEKALINVAAYCGISPVLRGLFIDGVYKTIANVISVMLPPMAIFFPLFALLEEVGYLPRAAFNLDGIYRRCGGCGRQGITMLMGFGCNACGVSGCRIIANKKQRNIAILTNNFAPCNGRFPTLIAMTGIFFTGAFPQFLSTAISTGLLMIIIITGIIMSMLVSFILSLLLPGEKEDTGFMELPHYRKPRILKTIVDSLKEKTLSSAARAVTVAAPAGALIWILANVNIGDKTLLSFITQFLDPAGKKMGLDGAILTGFILGLPANEIVLPIILMIYLGSGTMTETGSLVQLHDILTANGWTVRNAVCMIIFTLMHFPCSTACLTIKKETGSLKLTALAFLIPTICGIICCIAANILISIF